MRLLSFAARRLAVAGLILALLFSARDAFPTPVLADPLPPSQGGAGLALVPRPIPKAKADHQGELVFISFAPDGRTLFTSGASGPIVRWDVRSGETQRVFFGLPPVALSPDGRTLVWSQQHRPRYPVQLWDLVNDRSLALLDRHTDKVNSLAFRPDGKMIATGCDDGRIRAWEVATGRHVSSMQPFMDAVHALAFSSNGSLLASASEGRLALPPDGAVVRLWNAERGKKQRQWGGMRGTFTAVGFSGDGRFLAGGDDGGTVTLWDATTGLEVACFSVSRRRVIRGVQFSHDSRHLVVASSGSKDTPGEPITVWDTGTRCQVAHARSTSNSALCVTISPDGRTLAAGMSEGPLMLWDLSPLTGRP